MDGSARNKKGSNRERYFAKKLSEWSGEHVMRTLASGAGGTRAVSEIRMTGDLFFPINSNNCFSYEVKDHQSTRLSQVFNNNGDIPSFWQQCTTDALRLKKYGIVPVLLFHVKRERDYVLIPYNKDFYLKLLDNDKPAQVQLTSYLDDMLKKEKKYMTILTDIDGFCSVPAQDLFSMYRGLDFNKLNKNNKTEELNLNKLIDIDL